MSNFQFSIFNFQAREEKKGRLPNAVFLACKNSAGFTPSLKFRLPQPVPLEMGEHTVFQSSVSPRVSSGWQKSQSKFSAGFTLIEMTVAAGIFAVLAISAVSIMIAVSKAQAKIQRTQAAIDNIRYSLELITKEMRVATQYKLISPLVCGDSGTDEINFLASNGTERRYFIDTDTAGKKRLMRIKKTAPGAIGLPDCAGAISLTADDVTIDRFRVIFRGNTASPGSSDGQPWAVINMKASAIDPKGAAHSTMDLQTSITQRIRDFP